MKRKLAAIMAGDVVGYSRMMAEDEAGTYRELRETFDGIVEPAVDVHGGRIFKQNGDGYLASFPSVHEALDAAVEIQEALANRRFRLRIGLNLGDVIEDGDDTYGDGVNVAARLEAMAEPGTVYVSESVARSAEKSATRTFRRIGRRAAKNMPDGIQVYQLSRTAPIGPTVWQRASRHGTLRNAVLAGAVAATIGLGAVAGASVAPSTSHWFAGLPLVGDASEGSRPSVAVMPFANLGNGEGYFTDGLTEDLITELSRHPELAVVARNSTFALREEAQDARRVGRMLDARYVVEGSTRREGDQLRVSAQLIDATSGTHLWARSFDRRVEDVFAIQSELTAAIAASLVSYVQRSEVASANRRPTENLRAYDLVLRAREASVHKAAEPETFLQARTMLRQAIELDPTYAAAHAYLGLNLISDQVNAVTGTTTAADLETGIGEARNAIRLQPDLALGYRVLGFGLSVRGDTLEALQAAERAVELSPNDPDNLAALAKAQLRTGDFEPAAENAARARRLHPMAPNYYAFLEAQAYYAADRFDEAEAAMRDCLVGGDQRANCLRIAAAVDVRRGRMGNAKQAMTQLVQAEPDFSVQKERDTLRFGTTAMMDRYLADLNSARLTNAAAAATTTRRPGAI